MRLSIASKESFYDGRTEDASEGEGGQPELLLLACDGLWGRLSAGSAISFIRNRMYAGVSWKDGREHRFGLTVIHGLRPFPSDNLNFVR